MTIIALLVAALAPGALAGDIPAVTDKLSRLSTPAFSLMLPDTFQNGSKDWSKLEDLNRGNSTWLWGVVAVQGGRYTQEELEQFAGGETCPKSQGQTVLHPKRVRTKALLGVRISCGTPDGKPYGANPRVSGWTRVQANSPRFERRYTLHLNYWADPRSEEVQKLIDKIVLSFQEKGGATTVGGGKKLQTSGF